jgi:voltage-gated potassium channel Kch
MGKIMRGTFKKVIQFWSDDRSLSIMLVLLFLTVFVFYPLTGLGLLSNLYLHVAASLILVIGVLMILKHGRIAIFASIFAGLSIVMRWSDYGLHNPTLFFLHALLTTTSFIIFAILILFRVFRSGPVNIHRIQGAVIVYLFLGLIWAAFYQLVMLKIPNAFSLKPQAENLLAIQHELVYFSFSTLTTVGYGDITAINPIARSLAVAEALIGQLFPAILIARLVAMELEYKKERSP